MKKIICEKLIFSRHSVQKMFERKISKQNIRSILDNGEIIKEYPEDTPYPTALILGFIENRPLHLVTAFNKNEKFCIIVTVYEPDKDLWEDNFRRRKN